MMTLRDDPRYGNLYQMWHDPEQGKKRLATSRVLFPHYVDAERERSADEGGVIHNLLHLEPSLDPITVCGLRFSVGSEGDELGFQPYFGHEGTGCGRCADLSVFGVGVR